jgi:hypothetical protein
MVKMRAIKRWLLVFIASGLIWYYASFIATVGESLTGQASFATGLLLYIIRLLFLFTIPIAILAEVIRWYRGKTAKRSMR